jgi:hypothetical protein
MKPDDITYPLSTRLRGERAGVRGEKTSMHFSDRTPLGKTSLGQAFPFRLFAISPFPPKVHGPVKIRAAEMVAWT